MRDLVERLISFNCGQRLDVLSPLCANSYTLHSDLWSCRRTPEVISIWGRPRDRMSIMLGMDTYGYGVVCNSNRAVLDSPREVGWHACEINR